MGWCDRGIVHNALRADDKAITDLERALELDPTLDQAYVSLANVYFRQGRRQEGCYALQQAHDLGDRSVEHMLLVNCDQ
jgi:tetratricopeptide (TPR) repeat protein